MLASLAVLALPNVLLSASLSRTASTLSTPTSASSAALAQAYVLLMLPQQSNQILTYKDKGGGNFAFVFTELTVVRCFGKGKGARFAVSRRCDDVRVRQ